MSPSTGSSATRGLWRTPGADSNPGVRGHHSGIETPKRATVRGLVIGRRPRIGGSLRKVAIVGALCALVGVVAAVGGNQSAASGTVPRLASPGGHGLALRFPIRRAGADD